MIDIQSSGWWLNQPSWKICSSKWESSPSFGVNIKKYLSCHHLGDPEIQQMLYPFWKVTYPSYGRGNHLPRLPVCKGDIFVAWSVVLVVTGIPKRGFTSPGIMQKNARNTEVKRIQSLLQGTLYYQTKQCIVANVVRESLKITIDLYFLIPPKWVA